MNDTLKVAGRIGAELGAAKAEVERMREVLSRIANLPMYHCSTENDYRLSAAKAMAVAALSQQAEPVRSPRTEDTASMDSNSEQEQFTAVDMATAAAQGFRDGQAAVEHQSLNEWFLSLEPGRQAVLREDKWMLANAAFEAGCATRHAQTEQQPAVAYANFNEMELCLHKPADGAWTPVYAAPIAQTAPQPAPEGHEWVLLPIASGSQTEVKADNLKQALTLLDFGLAFALCNTDHGGTRRDVKKAQQHLEEVKAFLAAAPQPEQSGLVEPTFSMVQAACAAFRMDVSPMEAMTEALRAALSAQWTAEQ